MVLLQGARRILIKGGIVLTLDRQIGDFAQADVLIEDGRIDTKPWITHRAGFAELPEIFPSYTKPETGVIKAIVEVD